MLSVNSHLHCNVLTLQLTTLCHSLLERNLGGRSPVMQPSTDVGRRSLVSLVLQTTAVIHQNSTNPLLRPFVNVLNAERGLNVCIPMHINCPKAKIALLYECNYIYLCITFIS